MARLSHAPLRESLIERRFMLVSSSFHFLNERLMAQIERLRLSYPTQGLWVETESVESRESSGVFAQNLKIEISSVKTRLARLTDAYLAEALELADYLERKNALTAEKRTLEEKLGDFEREGTKWLELMRNWILEANEATTLGEQENPAKQKDFLVRIGSNRRLAAGMLVGEFRMPWEMLAGMPEYARAVGAEGVENGANKIWWSLVHHIRTCLRERKGIRLLQVVDTW